MEQKAIEKLKKEFEQTDEQGKAIINYCLLPELNNNPGFAIRITDEKKTVKKMLKEIKSWVRKSKNHAPSHDVVFSMALHYYYEDHPKYVKELVEEEPMKFGDVSKHFNQPIIKHITGTVVKETIKEVEKKTPKKDIREKVERHAKQLSLFEKQA